MIIKHKATALARQYHTSQFLSADQVADIFPSGSCYWGLKGGQEDYCYVVPWCQEIAQKPLQTGGWNSYYAVPKETGDVSVLMFGGE